MKCHYVPRAYLLRFCSVRDAPMIWVFDKQEERFLHIPVTCAAREHGFYTDDTERALAAYVEGPANPVIHKLLEKRELRSEDRLVLALYAAVMLMRVPAKRERGRAMAPEVLDRTVREMLAEIRDHPGEAAAPPGTVQGLIKELGRLHQQFLDQLPAQVISRIESPWPTPAMVTAIASMHWRIMSSTGPSYFLTSDNPAFFFTAYGLARREAELCLPLSTKLALLGNWQGSGPLQFVTVRQKVVKEMNRRVASSSTRYLFYHTAADWVRTLALKKDHDLNRVLW